MAKAPKKSKDALPTALKRTMFGMKPEDFVIIGIDTDHKSRSEHPLWDKRIELPLDEAMVRSVMAVGVLEPVKIRKNGDVPEIVFGRQRIRAAREANKRLIEKGDKPIVVNTTTVRGDDRTMLGLMVTENALRNDDSMSAKAELLKDLVDAGYSDKECATFFGVTQTAIRNWKKLFDCAEEVMEAVSTGELSASAAADLAVFPAEEQASKLEELRQQAAESGKAKITNQQTRNTRQKAEGSKHATAYKPPRKPVLTSVVELAEDSTAQHGLSADAVDVLKWALGHIPASEVPGLEEALATIDLRKKGDKLKLTDAQQAVVDKLLDGPHLYSDLNKKVTDAMINKEVIEVFTADDGTQNVKLTDSYRAILATRSAGEDEQSAEAAA